MSGADVEAIVVGAGIAGLAAARELAAAGVDPLVVDPGARPGGVMQTEEVDGYRIETGPNTFQAKPAFCAFASRHGLWDSLQTASPETRRRWLHHGGRLVELPHGIGSAIGTPLLSGRAKLRLLGEPFVSRGAGRDESVDAFVARRLGPEVATNLVGAFLTGVYAGDERELGAAAVFPGLVEWEERHGSVVRGAIAAGLARRRSGERGRPGTWSWDGGLGGLPSALAAALPTPPRLGSCVSSIDRDGDGYRVTISGRHGEEEIRARDVVLATPATPAARLLERVAPEAAKVLAAIDYAPIAAVGLGADPRRVRGAVEGFGFILPRASGTKLLGCLFMSRLFPGRAPEGRELLHCMLGGVRWREATDASDDELVGVLLDDLDATLGLEEAPRTLRIQRWPRAIPQPGVDHPARIAAARRAVAECAGLELAGGYLQGVSVADSLTSGVEAARALGERS